MKKVIFILVLITLMSVLSGLFAYNYDMEQSIIGRVQNLRFVPSPNPFSNSRTTALTNYVEQYLWDEWHDARSVFIGYDSQMRINRFLTYYWYDYREWEMDHNELVTYRPDGLPHSVITQHLILEDWVTTGEVLFTYDGNQLQSVLHQYIDGDIVETVMTITFEYNDATQRLEYVQVSGGWWRNPSRIFYRVYYEWDTPGRVISATTYYEDGADQWIPGSKTVISYHPQDNTNYQDYMNFFMQQLIIGEHDILPMGSVMYIDEEVDSNFYNDSWHPDNMFQYHYDQNMKLEQILRYSYSAYVWYNVMQEDFIYDDSGNMTEWLLGYDSGDYLDYYNRKVFTYSEVSTSEDYVSPPEISELSIYPNPFNPQTNISFEVLKGGKVEVDIFNLKGQKVRSILNDYKEKGNYQMSWNGFDDNGFKVGSGMYIVRLKSANNSRSKKVILLK